MALCKWVWWVIGSESTNFNFPTLFAMLYISSVSSAYLWNGISPRCTLLKGNLGVSVLRSHGHKISVVQQFCFNLNVFRSYAGMLYIPPQLNGWMVVTWPNIYFTSQPAAFVEYSAFSECSAIFVCLLLWINTTDSMLGHHSLAHSNTDDAQVTCILGTPLHLALHH